MVPAELPVVSDVAPADVPAPATVPMNVIGLPRPATRSYTPATAASSMSSRAMWNCERKPCASAVEYALDTAELAGVPLMPFAPLVR